MKDFKIITVDQVGIGDRVSRITKRSVKNEAKIDGLKMALNMIDLTTLEGADTENKVKQLCYKGMHLHDAYPNLPTVAAICVYPNFVGLAKQQLKGHIALAQENRVGLMLALGKSLLLFDKVDTNLEIFEKIDAITSENVLEIANEILIKENCSMLTFI